MDPPLDCSSCYMRQEENTTKSSFIKDEHKNSEDIPSTSTGVSRSSNSPLLDSAISTPSVRSSAIITYSAAKNPAVFSRLVPDTDLNLAPSNWLRKTVGLRPETLLSGGRYAARPHQSFSAFSMARSHLDSVGKVDVISDAENIKKLLKIPYSKAHVSMAIHRIGRTLLLENFDIKRYTAEESEWEWFKHFYTKLVQHSSNTLLKKKSPSSQYDRLMLSKFLYYSIHKDDAEKSDNRHFADDEDPDMCSNDQGRSEIKLIEIDDTMKEDGKPLLVDLSAAELSSLTAAGLSFSHMDEFHDEQNFHTNALVAAEKRWRYWTPPESQPPPQSETGEEFERNILWTFEDLQMMLGTNMPIFGGGRYPAVSLRLRDSSKPINILTGIDYWLDNLICNVPELLMCFHVNGIVQNYEVFKTEDIPNLEQSSFSPTVVKDIAQNILSFLKSNCTREGHTYWLFKGSEDDVVKLYDLTTLYDKSLTSEDGPSDKSQENPYIYSVAMLLYKTAINLMQSKDTCDHHVTVKKLLCHCIQLLDHAKYQSVVSRAICMLSTLYLPDPGFDLPISKEATNSSFPKDQGFETDIDGIEECDTCTAHQAIENSRLEKEPEVMNSTEVSEVASIPCVTDLSIPEKYQKVTAASFELMKSPPSKDKKTHANSDERINQIGDSCAKSLSYVVTGLKVLAQDTKRQQEDWKISLLGRLSQNAALAYFRLAEQANSQRKHGNTLRCIRLALQSYETYYFLANLSQTILNRKGEKYNPSKNQMSPPDFHLFLPRLLSLCGEVQWLIVEGIKSNSPPGDEEKNDYSVLTKEDKDITEAMKLMVPSGGQYADLTELSADIDNSLSLCLKCYQMSLNALENTNVEIGPKSQTNETLKPGNNNNMAGKDVKRKVKRAMDKLSGSATSVRLGLGGAVDTHQQGVMDSLKTTVMRRQGHVANEIGASGINKAVVMLNSDIKRNDAPTQEERDVCNSARSYFEHAHKSFIQVNDVINQALVLSNIGRLMRVFAQFFASNETGQISLHEWSYYKQAIEQYQKALALVGPKENKRACVSKSGSGVTCTTVYDNISWELSSSYYSMAQLLQDNAPRDQRASEDAEKEVIDLLTKSLKHCQDIWEKSPKQTLAQFRQAQIYHRMASLHHNSYRHCPDAHKCKYLRNLADKNYSKAIDFLEGLEHPSELLRFQLEQLAMKEHLINSMNNGNQKVKILLEGLTMLLNCMKPLRQIEKSAQIATKKKFSSQVDARERSIEADNITESAGLLRILATILQSFLLSLVKTTSSSNSPSLKGSSPIVKAQQQTYKDLCSRTLRALLPIKSGEKEEDSRSKAKKHPPEEEARRKLKMSTTIVLAVLKDVSDVVARL